MDDQFEADANRAHYKKYGAGWQAIRRAAIKRAGGECEIGDSTPWGRCTASDRPRLHVHHIGHLKYKELWPVLDYDDAELLLVHAYRLAWAKAYKALEEYLERNPELFPVLCPHHHMLFEYHPYYLLRVIREKKRWQYS